MAAFHRADQEPVNAFRLGDHYLFKHYFETDEIFARLRTHYHNSQYRFEVPVAEFKEIKSFLADYGYGLVAVHATAEFVVVVRKYTEHRGNIFKQSVIQRSVPKYNCFLMTSRSAVEDATRKTASANPLPEIGIEPVLVDTPYKLDGFFHFFGVNCRLLPQFNYGTTTAVPSRKDTGLLVWVDVRRRNRCA